jgi:hypothetical protein
VVRWPNNPGSVKNNFSCVCRDFKLMAIGTAEWWITMNTKGQLGQGGVWFTEDVGSDGSSEHL